MTENRKNGFFRKVFVDFVLNVTQVTLLSLNQVPVMCHLWPKIRQNVYAVALVVVLLVLAILPCFVVQVQQQLCGSHG